MLRYKTKTRPGLVALYDIRPGNGAGQFLQPQSPHGASFRIYAPIISDCNGEKIVKIGQQKPKMLEKNKSGTIVCGSGCKCDILNALTLHCLAFVTVGSYLAALSAQTGYIVPD